MVTVHPTPAAPFFPWRAQKNTGTAPAVHKKRTPPPKLQRGRSKEEGFAELYRVVGGTDEAPFAASGEVCAAAFLNPL